MKQIRSTRMQNQQVKNPFVRAEKYLAANLIYKVLIYVTRNYNT